MQALPYWRLSGYYFFYFAFLGAFSPYFGLYLQSLRFSAWDIGLLMSQMQLMRVVGPYLWGTLADRNGQRLRIVRLAGLVALAGFTGFFWLDRLAGMLPAMTLLAFFWSAALPLVETLTFDHLREEHGRYSRIRLWGSIGFIAAVMGTGALLDLLSPQAVLWACWVLLFGIFLMALLLPETGVRDVARATRPIVSILRQPRVRALLGACFAMSAAHGAYYVFFSIHLDAFGYSKFQVGSLWSLGVVAEILVFVFMGRIARCYSLRAILLACFAAAVIRFLLMGWGAAFPFLMIAVQLLHALTFGAYHASAITAINRWFPGSAQGRGQALYSSLSFGAGGLLGGLISGRVWDGWGAGWVFSLGAMFALVGLLLVWRWVDEAPGETLPDEAKTHDPVP